MLSAVVCDADGTLEEWVKSTREQAPRGETMPEYLATHMAEADPDELDEVLDAVNELSDRLERHLDIFSAEDAPISDELDHAAIRNICKTYRPAFVAALLIDCASQVHTLREPRSSYVGNLAIELIADLKRRPRHALARDTLAQAREREPQRWEALRSTVEELENDTRKWARWPSQEMAMRVCAQLSEVAPSWREASNQQRSAWRGTQRREQRRDPAFRRALRWHDLLVRIFGCLASDRGDLRLDLEYGLAVLDHCCNSEDLAGDTSTPELAVFEVFVRVERALGCSCAELKIGHARRRKRVQRARLRVLTDWRESIQAEHWQDKTLPQLLELADGIEQHNL